MDRFKGYFSFSGRINRKPYWLTVLAIYGVLIVLALLAALLSEVSGVLILILVPVFIALLVASLANGARRLHDRGKSAWWLLLFIGLPSVLTSAAQSDANAVLALLSLPFSLWGFVEMGFLRGTVGPNRFGPDPLQSDIGAEPDFSEA